MIDEDSLAYTLKRASLREEVRLRIQQKTDYIEVRNIRDDLAERLAKMTADHEKLTAKHTGEEIAALMAEVLPQERQGMQEMIDVCERRMEELRGERKEWKPSGKTN
ncbi:hypothetical protein LVO79_15545 [Roseivivax marinus]|uniref:hypothetical protein n=1 Tax=Roseivivax marinus TaxID=1379903 RepID=UPI001F036AF6|nr:hypothetical protein [Roseivivax marinus]UMA64407.1 hypothetical protein LVO79_15545 [Roseivivax marinus]